MEDVVKIVVRPNLEKDVRHREPAKGTEFQVQKQAVKNSRRLCETGRPGAAFIVIESSGAKIEFCWNGQLK